MGVPVSTTPVRHMFPRRPVPAPIGATGTLGDVMSTRRLILLSLACGLAILAAAAAQLFMASR